LAKEHPNLAEVYFLRGYIQSRHKSLTVPTAHTALDDLREALKRKKDCVDPVNKFWAGDAANELWRVVNLLKRYDLAVIEFQNLSTQEPDNVDYLYLLGMAHARGENYHL